MSGDAYNENANLVLTAEYNAKQYTVTFNVEEGATVNKTNMTVEYGKEYGELPIPTKENSEFIGWYTKDDKPVTQETIFKQTEDQQLYAKWESTIYHVYYNANRGTGAPSTQTRTKNGDAIEIQGPGNMTKGGHEFKQWEDAEGKVYAEGTEYSDNKDLTLYAIWDSESYKITYDANGGTGAPAPYWKEYDEKYVLSKEGIEREGFIFKGWGLSNTTLAKDAISEYSGNSNVTVYAIWEENTRELRYDTLRGTNEPENQTKYYTQNLQVTDTIPQKTGYNFLGWSTKPYGSTLDDVEYKAGNTITSNDISVLYAVWELQTCALTYEANGGTGTPEGETLNYGQKTQISTVVPTRDGYNFVAWGVKGNEKLQYAPGSDYTIYNDNVVLSAIWKAQTYTVVYNANGGKNAPGSQTKVYKEDLLLSTVKPTRKGYIFVGWAEEPTATEAKYNSGADDGYYTEDKDATLYAVWQATEEGVKYMYYCKVEATDEDTDENTFDDFNSAKEYADAHKEENIKVYDANGTLIYNPLNNNEELYLESEVFTGQGSVENGNGEKTEYVKVDANTQLLEIINNCSTNGTVEVYSKNGTKLANKDVLGTGMKIKVTNKNAKTEYEITIVVTGDLDSDGKMSVSDLSSMTSYHTGAVSLDGVYSIAADVDKDNEVTISDLSSMINDLSK